MKPFQNFGKEQKLLSTKARLVVLDVLFFCDLPKIPLSFWYKFEIRLAALHNNKGDWNTGGLHSLFESPAFVMS